MESERFNSLMMDKGRLNWRVCFYILILSTIFISCKDENVIKSSPSLRFNKVEIVKSLDQITDSLLIFYLNYEDEDGNIGLTDADSLAPFDEGRNKFNLWVNMKEIKNGTEIPVYIFGTTIPERFDRRIPNLTPTGKDKSIQGEIEITYSASKLILYPDSLSAEFQLLDRDLNKSEVVKVDEIVLSH